ncbi:MAG: NADH-quinone oxidoreductase subunit J [bacterium]|nr:NADH-quinone oxidoreductase subunit J [bacterium]
MGIADLFFYLFSALTTGSAVMVISARNPVHAVMFLILAFINAAGLFLLLGAEFLAMLLIIVYVGAVAVLFLFVVMMLDVDFAELRAGYMKYFPLGATIGFILLAELVVLFGAWKSDGGISVTPKVPIPDTAAITNTEAIGHVLYTDYIFYFEAVGIILLTAMVGAIVLTFRQNENAKRQNIGDQIARTPETSIEIKKVETGKGI